MRRRNSLRTAALVLVGAASTAGEKDEIRFSRRALFVGPYENAAVGDLDRDGRLDIVSGAYWFAGPDYVPRAFRPGHTAKEYMSENSVHVLDVDADGWPDILAGGWNEDGIYWYRNPGRSAADRGEPWRMHEPWQAKLLARTRGRMEMFALHDFDADGKPELFSACYRKEEPLEVFRFGKSASGDPELRPFVLGTEGGGHGFAFGDVNGDGREDVLTEVGWYERPAGDPWADPWRFRPETALPHPSCPFVVKDLNGDGRLDIVFGRGHDYGLFWWEQQAPRPDGTTAWKKHVIDESWSQAHALALADLDGDGSEELVAGKCIWAHEGGDPGAAEPPAVYYYKWHASRIAFTRHVIAAPGEGVALGRQYPVVDLDGDGRKDLVAPSELGLFVFMNQGASRSAAPRESR
jgi:FG-GAP-like repeat